MATAIAALASVKNRLSIKSSDTTFDTQLNDFIANAVLRLYPRASLEVDVQSTTCTVDSYGEANISLSSLTTPIQAARQVEAYDGQTWRIISKKYHHGSNLRLRGLSTTETSIRIYGLKNFPDITTVYDWLLQAVYWYAMAEFYDTLAGSQKNYNIYMQATGSRAVDNMRDESTYYDTKADNYVEQQNQSYGL